MGLVTPTDGRITWGGREQVPPRRRAFVFQRPAMLRRSAAGNVRYALATAGAARAERSARAHKLLDRVGHAARCDRPARRLSGGEQQRLALARALARDPTVLFLDEPTASLDPAATKAIEDLVVAIADSGVKVVMATHDLGEARRLAGEIVLMHRGAIVETGPAAAFFAAPQTDQAKRFIAGELLV
jgi:tungstate transport system ATP-binding protein